MGTVSLYSSKGYPSFRVPTVAPGPTSGEDASLQVGPKLVLRVNHGMTGDWGAVLACLLMRRINSAHMLTHALSICLRSHELSHLSPRLTHPRPHVWRFHRAMRGAPRCHRLG
jgi:hypothetical protein